MQYTSLLTHVSQFRHFRILTIGLTSGVRRFLKRGGGQFGPIFRPKLGEEQKKRSSFKFGPMFRPKLGEEQKKKGLYSKLVRFFAQTWVQAWKKHIEHTLCVIKPYAQLPKRGTMPQFCLLFYAILQSWRPKGGAMAQWPPLNTPLGLTLYLPGFFYTLFVHGGGKFAPLFKNRLVSDRSNIFCLLKLFLLNF